MLIPIILAVAGLLVGAGVGYAVRQQMAGKKAIGAEAKAEDLLKQAQAQEQKMILEAKEKALKVVEDSKKEDRERSDKAVQLEERLEKRESSIEQKLDSIEREREQLAASKKTLEQAQEKLDSEKQTALKKIDEIRAQQLERLEKIATLPKERAEELVLELTEQNMKDRVLKQIKKSEDYFKAEKERLAKRVIAMAIWRMASEVTTEHASSTLELPSEEMKGRIIGKEGRNIKSLENLTGVELLVDETPNAIVISGFSAIRRYIAKLAIEQLIQDGRIHPGHIEQAVEKAKKTVEKKIREAGEAALKEVGIRTKHPKFAEVAGRLLFRTSYGQNQLKHAIEVSHLAGMMAVEIGANVQVAKAAGFLHDIGKAIDHEVEGTHGDIGVRLMKKFGISEEIIAAAETHHHDENTSAEAFVVAAADAISASRPGARRNTTEEYFKRVTDLEKIASAFEGVENVFAIEAGREIRVMVQPDMIDDLKAKKLAHAISDKVEQELSYPGEIKISVIRETRAVDYAK